MISNLGCYKESACPIKPTAWSCTVSASSSCSAVPVLGFIPAVLTEWTLINYLQRSWRSGEKPWETLLPRKQTPLRHNLAEETGQDETKRTSGMRRTTEGRTFTSDPGQTDVLNVNHWNCIGWKLQFFMFRNRINLISDLISNCSDWTCFHVSYNWG